MITVVSVHSSEGFLALDVSFNYKSPNVKKTGRQLVKLQYANNCRVSIQIIQQQKTV